MVRGSAVALTLALAVSAFVPAAAQPQPPRPAIPVDLELVLAVDVSGSIDPDEARLQRQGYVAAFADPAVVRAVTFGPFGRIAVTYFEWAGSGWQVPVIGWTLIDKAAAAPVGTGPWTSISGAIDFAVPLFGSGYEGTRRVVDLSGDGPNNTGRLAPEARDDAVRRRITINGLPIMNDRFDLSHPPMPNLDLYYRNCVIGGPGAFIVVARGFPAFAEAIRRKLVLEIAGDAPPDAAPVPAGRRYAQAGRPAAAPDGRWVPPCDEGERRFRGIIVDE